MSLLTILLTFPALWTDIIMAQLLCKNELENENSSCCFPNCRMNCDQICPEAYFLIHNNSKVLCSRNGVIEAIQMINTNFSGKPFCVKTCPDGFQALVIESVFTCMECKTACNVQKLVNHYSNTTETNTKHKSFETSIIAVVSSVAVVAIVAIVISIIVCCLVKTRYSTSSGKEQTKHTDKEASEMENGIKSEDLENSEKADDQENSGNKYVKDPTTGTKRENSTDNDAYDYAEERIVNINAYKEKESRNDEDDSDGYEGYMEINSAALAEQNKTDFSAQQTLSSDYHKHDNPSPKNPLDCSGNKTDIENQATSVESNHVNDSKEIESEDCYYVNQSASNNSIDYENTKFNIITTEKVVAVQSNCVNVKSVNDMTACNTNTINVTHAENVCIQNTTHLHFPNDNESKSKKIDKKTNSL